MRSSTYKILVWVGVIVFLGFIFYAYESQSRYAQNFPETVVNFQADNVMGGKTDYASEKGTATLIVLTASWCPACRAEIPTLNSFNDEFGPKGLKILMIDEDDSKKVARKFKKSLGIPWTMLHWNYNAINALGNPGVIPVSYLVDKDDKIQHIDVGAINELRVRHELKRLLGK
ncbi:MAG: TlpA family protein disulfide reductase [Fibrobacter sp.]|jgi:thiol-disulfide isomerase/thioredoxin|nr:TlpA family protein disulfide reductase [Fibrobacter sp.]